MLKFLLWTAAAAGIGWWITVTFVRPPGEETSGLDKLDTEALEQTIMQDGIYLGKDIIVYWEDYALSHELSQHNKF